MIKAEELRERFSKLSVLVVGDICLDIDYIGGYSGYSREVEQLPIFRAESVKYSPGGGGNLAVCFATLGVRTAVAGFLGITDPNTNILKDYFANMNIKTNPMRIHIGLTGTFGKAYFENGQHIYRSDIVATKIRNDDNILMADDIKYFSKQYDFVACADYEEAHEFGVCSPEVIEAVRANAKVKFATSRRHCHSFKEYDYLIQNEKEIGSPKDIQFRSESDMLKTITQMLNLKTVVMTKGGMGSSSYSSETGFSESLSKELTENIDPCGCGDMFYAIYASSVMAGFDTTTCLQLANAGARCVARKLFGTGQADCEEIASEWEYLYGQV